MVYKSWKVSFVSLIVFVLLMFWAINTSDTNMEANASNATSTVITNTNPEN